MELKSRKRPWLAAVLGALATGAGHLYLRRWKRAFGWVATAMATGILFVEPAEAEAFLYHQGPIAPMFPVLAVVLASAFDAYLVARAQNETAKRTVNPDGTITHCPYCGKELDGDLDFCQWCTTELDDFRVASPDDDSEMTTRRE
ncbi:zinc ribbon domain-containing protein [Halogeometricum borinquense]|uniref:Zinc ribbon domain-containing protein n=1 Tax=Halogeometricum borinquense TaxID=60847 RepID=A0A6C0UDI9_9EURY|nr:zinc ribbon domain-containing protein [Halogeometricum borinquense]QIB73197.1 zinc ribbon domain-containing protein [Halogeometricum borinquense]QIQ77407.1 zinc ribbon domain-containing protein [Halogeometricum borinquense]